MNETAGGSLFVIGWGFAALCVLGDGLWRKLRGMALLWAVGTFILGILVAPAYYAYRPLRKGEIREGGKAWNYLKFLALTWSASILLLAISYFSSAENAASDEAILIGVLGFGVAWFLPMIGAVLLGFFLKKSSIVEHGPTGHLATSEEATQP